MLLLTPRSLQRGRNRARRDASARTFSRRSHKLERAGRRGDPDGQLHGLVEPEELCRVLPLRRPRADAPGQRPGVTASRATAPSASSPGDDVRRLADPEHHLPRRQGTAAGADGGAIELTGFSGLQVFNSAFFANQANDRGGAIHIRRDTPTPFDNSLGFSSFGNVFGSTTVAGDVNTAGIGGAISVETPGVNDQFSLTSNTVREQHRNRNRRRRSTSRFPGRGRERLAERQPGVRQPRRGIRRRRTSRRPDRVAACRQLALRGQFGRAVDGISGG